MGIVRKCVAFNIVDPDQKAMLDHAGKRTNFSAYIKRLIQRDMERDMEGGVFPSITTKNSPETTLLMEGLI